ncbi:DUF4954 family protein [Pirellulales bacterium]|nr:DUF4954 family protein [Pirellulales bacterium]
MTLDREYRPLHADEITVLKQQGCTAEVWSDVWGTPDFSPDNIRDARFAGTVRLGRLTGKVRGDAGQERPAGIYQATLNNCTVGNEVRISQVRSQVANYEIGSGAYIEDVGLLLAHPGASFGNGVRVEALNEGGGREATLFNELSAQFAFLQVAHRSQPRVNEQLDRIAEQAAARARSDRGTIGAGSTICGVTRMVDVSIGEHAVVCGATELENGTILSSPEAPTTVGAAVIAKDFIIAEGTCVDSGAILGSSFVGQSCQIGKQFSAESSLFFANCEAFHGEACSVFAGPYTVTHHKSSLLIAGMFSFYNAGSGTNQSNHMYKLGPVHEGKLERGCKTGSFSYLMWPCRVGPFSVVLGKHTRTFDTCDFPFSHLEAKADGRCEMVPGLYLSTVGTVRDGAKWPARDRRQGSVRRDLIDFPVFNPLTVGRMLRGSTRLSQLHKETPRSIKIVAVNGTEVRRVLLRTGVKYYRAGIEMYLLERLVSRIEQARAAGQNDLSQALALDAGAIFSEEWIDVAGQLMPRARFDQLCQHLERGELETVEQLHAELGQFHAAYTADEWAWVSWAYERIFEQQPQHLSLKSVQQAAQQWKQVRTKFLNLILNDASKEFENVTQTGFGHSDKAEERVADFTTVRGTFDENKFVVQIRAEITDVEQRTDAI